MKTWRYELAVVALVLAGVVALTGGSWLESLGATAVLVGFAHAQVTSRMAERQAAQAKPDVGCYRWSLRYHLAKELLWLAYFIAHRSWAALVSVGVFLLYPLWRRWWRARNPIAPMRIIIVKPSKVFINGCQFDLMPATDVSMNQPWSAGLVLRLDRSECEFMATCSRDRAPLQVAFQIGGDLLFGHGQVRRLQFFDDAKQPGVRFATINVAGIGELCHA